ncbi:hypothetical protein [Burkholderia ubonensis]|uniref:hypothetical protein n=1 Tax=Burkholderia ubonensis TaxID=101571 RepID=UPI0012FCA460|nr:hypothetical protein [Burkholderia ubonensis]
MKTFRRQINGCKLASPDPDATHANTYSQRYAHHLSSKDTLQDQARGDAGQSAPGDP